MNDLWPEYRYRHEHVWGNVYKLTFAVAFLSVLPYLQVEVACVVQRWVAWLPALAVSLAFFGLFRGYRELLVLEQIKETHRKRLEIRDLAGPGRFRRHMMVYLSLLATAALVNLWVVATVWVPRLMGSELCQAAAVKAGS